MTLEEAIKHCREKAEDLRKEVVWGFANTFIRDETDCLECAAEHEQLAEWLEELKERREKDEKRRHTCSSCSFFKKSKYADYGRCSIKDAEGVETRLSRARGCKSYERRGKNDRS